MLRVKQILLTNVAIGIEREEFYVYTNLGLPKLGT